MRDYLYRPTTTGVQTTDTMLTIEQVRHVADSEPDLAELLREFSKVQLFYREAVAAMALHEPPVTPVLSSAELTLSFQTAADAITLDLSEESKAITSFLR